MTDRKTTDLALTDDAASDDAASDDATSDAAASDVAASDAAASDAGISDDVAADAAPTDAAPRQRKIIHVDMDAFFAAVEMRDDPALRDVPLAVGGRPERRGVVATANYEARRFGVHSAMASARAVRLCANLVLVPPRFDVYRAESGRIRNIFRRYTDLVEPQSLDEAFLDVTDSPACDGSATRMAEQIRREIRETTGLTASAGVAPNRFLAKVGSDWNKPDGQFVITPAQVAAFVHALPVGRIPGVGRVTGERLAGLKVATCGDLQALGVATLESHFGRWGKRLYELARGIDDRPIVPHRVRKQLSVERTFDEDLPDLDACHYELERLHGVFLERYQQAAVADRVRGFTVKLRFEDFETTTIDRAGLGAPELEVFAELLEAAWDRGERPVRLIGMGVRLAEPPRVPRAGEQFELWPGGW